MASNLAGMAFIPYYNHIMKILETDPRLKSTAKGIFSQMAYAAGGAAVGGMVAGPAGAMIGGIAGSLYGYTKVDDYDSLLIVLKEMSDGEKEELVKKVQELVGSAGLEGLTSFIGSQVNREVLINLVQQFARESGEKADNSANEFLENLQTSKPTKKNQVYPDLGL